MKEYSNSISLIRNSRGVYCLDPSMGCYSGTRQSKKGCYNECYAEKSARLYGYDFTKTVLRNFDDEFHKQSIISEINRIKMPFIRMGCSGDPSENWKHTISICKQINIGTKTNQFYLYRNGFNKGVNIVIITKHWNLMTNDELSEISNYNVIFNTSISALDENIFKLIHEYERIGNYTKSILRMVTFDFNKKNELGYYYDQLQSDILSKYKVLDTVFRCSKNNPLVRDGIINTKKSKFLGKTINVSKNNKKTYLGKCDTCLEMCGIYM